MSAPAVGTPKSCHVLDPECLDSIQQLMLTATPESLEQAILRLEEIRTQLAVEASGPHGPGLTPARLSGFRERLERLRQCAERGQQMVSGRLQLILGSDLLYDREARPSTDCLPSRVQVEG